MKAKCLIFLIFVSRLLCIADDSTKVSYLKLSVVGSTAAVASGASYFVMKNAWWSENSTDFHFDTGADLKYAKNVDKAAHFYGGYIAQDLYYRSLTWSGLSKKKSLWWSFGLSSYAQILIDMKDGFAEKWGFSYWDVISGVGGAGYGTLQKVYPCIQDYKIKMTYYRRPRDHNYRYEWLIEEIIEDYPNQTYWITAPFSRIISSLPKRIIPDFLGIACGLSVEDKLIPFGELNPKHQLYISLDIDFEKLFKPLDNKFLDSAAHYLNYIKFPLPALRFYPSAKCYWIYM